MREDHTDRLKRERADRSAIRAMLMLPRRLLRRIYSAYLSGLDYDQIRQKVFYDTGRILSDHEIDEVINMLNEL